MRFSLFPRPIAILLIAGLLTATLAGCQTGSMGS